MLLNEIKKLNTFLQTWRQCNELMTSNFVHSFRSDQKNGVTKISNIDCYDQVENLPKREHLQSGLTNIQNLLKSMFFDSKTQNEFFIQDVEQLFVSAEIILKTHFREAFVRIQFQEEKNDEINFTLNNEAVNSKVLREIIENLQQNGINSELVQQAFDNNLIISPCLSVEKSENLSKVFRYLLNMRVIALILGNVFWNQIAILVRTRVVYDKELFNFEEYR